MATTIRRLKRSVQKVAKHGGLNAEDTALVQDIVESIARTGKVHLSEVARRLKGKHEELIDPERAVLVPGDPEREVAAERRRAGVPLAAPLAAQIEAICQRCGVPYRLGEDGAA